MRRKTNNDLILISDGKKINAYFTSATRAGAVIGLAAPSVQWAIDRHNTIETIGGKKVTITLVDGSEIPYKLINNNKL